MTEIDSVVAASEKSIDMSKVSISISKDLSLDIVGVRNVLKLFDEGATIPFIARYRKEASGDMNEVDIRNIQERSSYLIELFKRKNTVLETIESQGKLDEALKNKIEACETKVELEDLYLPFKPKKRTKATIAREKGLELWLQES